MSRRTERVEELLRGEIASLLHRDVTDPRVKLVTLTRVDVSPDLRNAMVYWSRVDAKGAPPPEEVAAGLESAAGFLRRRLSERLVLKRMPALSFRFDPSLELGNQTLNTLRELSDGPA